MVGWQLVVQAGIEGNTRYAAHFPQLLRLAAGIDN